MAISPKTQRLELEKIAQNSSSKYDAGGATGIMKTATELTKAGFTFKQALGVAGTGIGFVSARWRYDAG